MSDSRRALILGAWHAALAAVDGRSVTRAALAGEPRGIPWVVAAVGKAAGAMALGAHEALGAAIERSLVITKEGHVPEGLRRRPVARVIESAHPLPDARSLEAGAALLAWLEALAPDRRLLLLVSGGASSLVEVLKPGYTLGELQALNEQGLADGRPIGELNAARAQLSLLKGGGLTRRLGTRPALALFLSDVPDDDPAVIGGGLLAPLAGDRIERRIVANVEQAMAAAARAVRSEGMLEAVVAPQRLAGEVAALAPRLVQELVAGSEPVRIWGGEPTVRLPPTPGRGGRNQHLALLVAQLIAGRADLLLLTAGTDGTDGPTADAGALVDGGSCGRIVHAGLDAEGCLRRADSGTALAAAGDLLRTGPTGTNVGDLVIGLKLAP